MWAWFIPGLQKGADGLGERGEGEETGSVRTVHPWGRLLLPVPSFFTI